MNLIVAVDENWAIGNKGKLLVSIPSDMKFFREETSGEGKAVILGRKTLESFPGGRPLKNRLNVVLTKNQDFQVEGAVVVHSVEEALEAVKDYADDKIYVIGGDTIYHQFLPYCNLAHVTKIYHGFEADAYFPNLDEMPEWKVTGESDEQTYFDLEFHFVRYERK